jgi:hypothetical protein
MASLLREHRRVGAGVRVGPHTLATYVTLVVSVSVLFEEFGSGEEEVTEAVLVIGPFVGDFTTIVIVAAVPLARPPREQVTVAFAGFASQVPFVVEAEAYPAFFGN